MTKQNMTFIKTRAYGPAEGLIPNTGPIPEPGCGEVLIQVSAAGVNRPDVLQRTGNYPPPPGASDVLGLEVAGTIVAVGEAVSDWQIGDQVCALVASGGYAEYCIAPAPQCLPVPKNFSMVEAAGLPETFFTVWTNVFERGKLQKGETVLIHGGSSGIGTTAIQLAHVFGARVFTTVGTDAKCVFCEHLGAEKAINYREKNFVAEVKSLTGGQGVDLILDMVGGPYIEKNMDALAMEGRLVQIAFLQESRVSVDFLPIMVKRLTLTGSTLRPRTVEQKGSIAKALREKVWPLLDAGTVKPIIHATFPLEQAADAHRLMESSTHIGKIILEVKP
ncbi:NAD(P)H-quinone oxidoreductase [Geoalkalibacter sp.]|uniref:NAD(P)H-quinone oxidoreductase n=1 Tax=Geoalkalibacter sp. TaxID=3041440 RepID=UPI00272EBC8D|nr:NAD(P)H-quinone oxidoreductase [Geoalkalibacter sp.]